MTDAKFYIGSLDINVGPAYTQRKHIKPPLFNNVPSNNLYSAGIDIRRQNLTSVDVRF